MDIIHSYSKIRFFVQPLVRSNTSWVNTSQTDHDKSTNHNIYKVSFGPSSGIVNHLPYGMWNITLIKYIFYLIVI